MDQQTASTSPASPVREEIERRAYDRFVQRGRVHGLDVDDWLLAERDVRRTASASDSHTAAGISNRESPQAEDAERQRLAPVPTEPHDVEDEGEPPSAAITDNQTSNKTGSRSTGQKRTESRYADRTAPQSSKVAGAFGKERRDVPSE